MTGVSSAQRRDLVGVTDDATDLRNAERLVERHGDDLRYVGTWGKWLAWDGTRWVVDDVGRALSMAAETTRAMLAEALEVLSPARRALDEARAEPESEHRQACVDAARRRVVAAEGAFKWAVLSQNAPRLRAMLDIAKSFPTVVVTHEALDTNPSLLNVKNGTIDLLTGVLRPHDRTDLCTKIVPVAFDPAAVAPTWDAFLTRVMGGDGQLVDFLWRIVGYALTGDVTEHVLVFFYGGGANGKSTFLSTIHAMMGDYAMPAARGLLFRSRGERHPTEVADLHGRRFVTCSEVEEGQAFDEALVKDLTGGDPIKARRMREDFWTFWPTHKLIMAGNHKPTVRGDDEGIWRRMRLVPWAVTIPEAERDTGFLEKLRVELPGVLAWAVQGCLAWRARGLEAPDVVRVATRQYRDENDIVGQFLRLHVVFEPEADITRKALRESYEDFCKENGAEPLGARRFSGRLREQGVTDKSVRDDWGKPRDGWRGVRMATDPERAAAAAWGGQRRDVVTRRDSDGDQPLARAHTETSNADPAATSPYVPTGREQMYLQILGEPKAGA